jgi:hypothetical protein
VHEPAPPSLHRRLLQVVAVAYAAACAAACSSEPAAPLDVPDATAGGDGGDAAGVPCFFCYDAAALDIDASVAKRAQLQLQSCAGVEGCHSVSPQVPLIFQAGNELADIINVPSVERPELMRVKPGDPENSYLFLKVQGDGGIEGGRMPLGAAYNPRIPKLFFDWIEAGAPDAE